MSQLFRAFVNRSPKRLNQQDINAFGIQTHPEQYQSQRFRDWHRLCKLNDVAALTADMSKFLRSSESIKKTDDLGNEWSGLIKVFQAAGNKITKEQALKAIKNSCIEGVFSNKEAYVARFTAIADTVVSLAFLKSLGYKDNMDYQTAIRVMAFTERAYDLKMQLPEINITRYLDRKLLLPYCFFHMDVCGNVINTDIPFPHLNDATALIRPDNRPVKGCVSGNCTCHTNDECVPQSKCCAKPRIDIIDLMMVQDETKCYHAGDLSYIKNVMQGESLSSTHRRLAKTELTIEQEEDIRQFEERYLQTEEKASLLQETDNIIKQDNTWSAGLTTNSNFGVKVKIFDAGGGTNSTTNFSGSTSKTFSNKEVRDYSRDVIDRATRQVEDKVRKLVSAKTILEVEEENKSSFDNTGGENVSGQYLYVNKLSTGQVYQYDVAAALNIYLPEPSSLYKKLFEKKFEGIEPVKPAQLTTDPKSITAENYKLLAIQYGIKDVPAPPPLKKEVYIHFDGGTGEEKGHVSRGKWTYFGSGSETNSAGLGVPDGYVTDSMSTDFGSVLFNGHSVTNCYLELKIGSNVVFKDGDNGNSQNAISPMNQYEGSQSIQYYGNNVTEFHLDIKVTFKIKDEKLLEWQLGVFAAIREAYEKAVEKYEKAFAEYLKNKEAFERRQEELKKERYNKHPLINEKTTATELKRMTISYISCQYFDQFDAMKNRMEPCGDPDMNFREAEEEGKFIQFFEQAFNWELMAYIFYPYFWGRKCTWKDKIQELSGDQAFEKFLQAGSCRVLIPVRKGWLDYVSYFLLTGEIWMGTGSIPVSGDPHYVSLAQEIKEQQQNFNADREGTIDVTNGSNTIILNGTDHYWNIITNSLHTVNITADTDRQIFIAGKAYRIVAIQPNPAVATHDSWIITIDRTYTGNTQTNLKWSTGALFVGAPWEFVTPTTLTFLRDKSSCLPCYPLKECKEQ